MNKRRTFLKKLVVGAAALPVFTFTGKSALANKPIKNALLHHVYFWLNNPDSETDRKQFEAAIQKLLKVETIQQSHFGVPAPTAERDVVDHSYTYSMLLIFNSKADQDTYQTHALHQQFVEENSSLWKKVVVYDSTDLKL